jgi:hypothetical protein
MVVVVAYCEYHFVPSGISCGMSSLAVLSQWKTGDVDAPLLLGKAPPAISRQTLVLSLPSLWSCRRASSSWSSAMPVV